MTTLGSQAFHSHSGNRLVSQCLRAVGSLWTDLVVQRQRRNRTTNKILSAQDLLALADQYESSFPGQAADLRAAVARALRRMD